jgi:hypothetical protein
MVGRRAHRAAGVAAEREVARGRSTPPTPSPTTSRRDAVRRRAVDGRAEVRVLAVHRERQLVGDRLADEARAGIEQALHGRRGVVLMPDIASTNGWPPPVG